MLASPAARGLTSSAGLVTIVNSSATSALMATTKAGVLNGRTFCDQALKSTRNITITLAVPQNTKGCGPNKGAKTADSGPGQRAAPRDIAATPVDVRGRSNRLSLTNRASDGVLASEIQLTRAGSIVIGRPDPMFLPRGV
jgi:hypothetical protein